MNFWQTVTAWDGVTLKSIQDVLVSDTLTPVMRIITLFGEAGIFWIIATLILLLLKETRHEGFVIACSLALCFIVCNLIIKPYVDRPRPWETFDYILRLAPDPGDASFPSGHASNSMATAFAMLLNLKKKWIGVLAVVLALLIALSRLYLGMHFPTDVLAGLIVGMLCATICWLVDKCIVKRNSL